MTYEDAQHLRDQLQTTGVKAIIINECDPSVGLTNDYSVHIVVAGHVYCVSHEDAEEVFLFNYGYLAVNGEAE